MTIVKIEARARGMDVGSWLLLALGVVLVVAGVRARSHEEVER